MEFISAKLCFSKLKLNQFWKGFISPFAKIPTLESLANANEDELLKAWQGLGYYTRARNLKRQL